MESIRYSAVTVRDAESATGSALDLDEVIGLYRRSTLGERRPVDDRETMRQMMAHADVVMAAWDGTRLVGIARTLTDFAYVAYLADLAVDAAYQRRGIGRELIRLTQEALGPRCFITLLAAPAAGDYYPKVGFERHPSAWIRRPKPGNDGTGGAGA